MSSRRIIALLACLLLAAFATESSAAVTAKAATTSLERQVAPMGVTSSGQVVSLGKPPSWLKPNTLIRPLEPVSPDQLSANGYYVCFSAISCLNNWNNGGAGNLIRWYHYTTSTNPNNQYNWWFEGYVYPQGSWPFTAGTGINNTYEGNPVYKFAYAPNDQGSGNCISQELFGSGSTSSHVDLAGCACSTCQNLKTAKSQFFVLDGNGRLVAVGATNKYVAYFNNNGGRVWVGVGDNGSYADGVDVYLTDNLANSKLVFRAYI